VIFCLLLLQNLVFRLSFNFCNLVFLLLFSFCNLVFAFSFCKKNKNKIGVIFCLPLLQNLVFRLSFSFCNLVFLSVFAIVLVFHLLFSFCNLVSASAIWYFCLVSAIVLIFCLLFSFYNLVFELSFCKKKIWSDILSSASAKSGISTVLQLLQFGISVCLCNCFGILSSLQFLQFGISFCNLVFLFFLCNCLGILSSLQFLHLVFELSFCKKNFGVIFYLPLLQNLVFRLSFSFCHGIYYQRDCLVTLVTC